MDFRFTEEQEDFRREVREFLAENLGEDWNGIVPDDYFTDENWRTIRNLTGKLVERGWLTLAWPEEYGGQGRPHIEQMIYNEGDGLFPRSHAGHEHGNAHGRPVHYVVRH